MCFSEVVVERQHSIITPPHPAKNTSITHRWSISHLNVCSLCTKLLKSPHDIFTTSRDAPGCLFMRRANHFLSTLPINFITTSLLSGVPSA